MTTKLDYPSLPEILKRNGVDISVYESKFFESTLKTRMEITKCHTVEDYTLIIKKEQNELTELVGLLSNSYSEFFRNPLTFALIEQLIVPRLFAIEKEQRKEIRIWSAGCAAGQEPYSLAILLNEYRQLYNAKCAIRIFATDSSKKQLEIARQGKYDFKNVQNTKLAFLQKYFNRQGDTFFLSNEIIKQVDFSLYDLLDQSSNAPPESVYGDFDLVICSNVFFYYKEAYQYIILKKLQRSLRKNGIFITGEAETRIVNSNGGFRKYLEPSGIYVKL